MTAPNPAPDRPFRAYDGDGVYLGSFAAEAAAHRWAHQRAAEPATRLPVEVEDRFRERVHQIWPDSCQTLRYRLPAVARRCPLDPA